MNDELMNNPVENEKIKVILERYLEKLKSNTLTCEEKIHLVHFVANDITNVGEMKLNIPMVFSNDEIQRFLTLGWYISSLLE